MFQSCSLLLSAMIVLSPVSSLALSATDWQAGRIIDDDIFSNSSSMSVTEIQAFLNAKVPTCDTNGDQLMSSGQTRKQYAIANGKQQPPYTCLRDYYEVPKTGPGLLFSSWRSHTASNQAVIANPQNSELLFADLNGNSVDEPVLVGLNGTSSGMIEFHVWNNDMQTWQSHTVSNQPVVDPANTQVSFADLNGDSVDEPVLVGLNGTSSGMIEFHVWNNDMQTWQSHTVSNQPVVDPAINKVLFADQINQNRDYAILVVLSSSQSGKVEFHTWNSGFNSWATHVASNQSSVDATRNIVRFGDLNGDGKQEPVLVGLNGTGSGNVEFHVWNNSQSAWKANLASNQSSVDATRNIVRFGDLNGDGKQEPVLVGLNGTGSGNVEFHVWEPGIPPNNYGRATPSGAKSAAQLIWDAAQKNRVSPKVLLATIQKESAGPLTTDDWPFEKFYTYAMGAYCPDSGPGGSANCDPDYAGFSIQISESAALFRYYIDNMTQPWWPYKTQGTNPILYHPNQSCGSSNVNILTKATAALYTYTPYQPNQAALNNLGGEGDSCSAYGNRNFWRIYSQWFGSPTGQCLSDEQPSASVGRLYNPSNYKHFLTAYSCEASVLQKSGYQYEGGAFYQAPASSPYAVVVHRLYNPSTQQHLWATTQDDINSATQQSGYRYEGPAFYAVKPEVPNLVVVHRLYNPVSFEHLWVTTQAEINSATQQSGYRYEGVAFYAAPPPH
jgi:hypothetical protein